MTTAYEILGVAEDADDEAIKKAYLQQIKLHPPEQSPQAFEAIRAAYELIKTPQDRAAYFLFAAPDIDLEAVLTQHLSTGKARRPSVQQILNAIADTCG